MPDSSRIFLVTGKESDYDSHEQWVVATWDTLEEAEAHCKKATAHSVKYHHDKAPSFEMTDKQKDLARKHPLNPYDPTYRWSAFGSGVMYSWEEIEPFTL